MNKKILPTAILASVCALSLVACSSNQSIETSDGKTIVTDGKPQIDKDTGLVSYKDAKTGQQQQINRNEIKNMSELEN